VEDERRLLLRRLLELEGAGKEDRTVLSIYDEWLSILPDTRTTIARRRYRIWLEFVFPLAGERVALGHLLVSHVTPAVLIAWQSAVARTPTKHGGPRAPGSADQVRLAIQNAFSFAVANGYMRRNFLLRGGGVPRLPGHDRKRKGAMTAEKVALVLPHLTIPDRWIYKHTWDTGARSSAIRCLRKSEIDYEDSRLRMPGKKPGSRIEIVVPRKTLEEMRRLADVSLSDYVYPNPLDPDGGPVPDNTHYQRVQRAYEAAGITQLSGERPGRHSLRHGKARETLAETGDITLVKRLLTHSTIATTMRYADDEETQARRLADHFDPPDDSDD
jgi:integrase